ncbi:hypothetical protein SEPCBS57363_002987 [Sporothrix epigloea]|uniref:AT hook domain-containing protein n=1 Tax=Sporothrix epigloea TaxID=1892477 RepID=A0ABP0DIY2_9PEZI
MPPKAASRDGDATVAKTTRPVQEDAAKVTKTGKGTGKRGRPKMDPALRKTQPYVPTGRPRGRPPKDPSKPKAPAAPKAPSEAGKAVRSGPGRGRPIGLTKKPITSTATAVASVAAALSAARNSSSKRDRKSKATMEAERSQAEAALNGVISTSNVDDGDGDES